MVPDGLLGNEVAPPCEADKSTLLRRANVDLTGLLPTKEKRLRSREIPGHTLSNSQSGWVQRGFEEISLRLELKEQVEQHERELSHVRELLNLPEPEIFIR